MRPGRKQAPAVAVHTDHGVHVAQAFRSGVHLHVPQHIPQDVLVRVPPTALAVEATIELRRRAGRRQDRRGQGKPQRRGLALSHVLEVLALRVLGVGGVQLARPEPLAEQNQLLRGQPPRRSAAAAAAAAAAGVRRRRLAVVVVDRPRAGAAARALASPRPQHVARERLQPPGRVLIDRLERLHGLFESFRRVG